LTLVPPDMSRRRPLPEIFVQYDNQSFFHFS
jgi:hypothetical protein